MPRAAPLQHSCCSYCLDLSRRAKRLSSPRGPRDAQSASMRPSHQHLKEAPSRGLQGPPRPMRRHREHVRRLPHPRQTRAPPHLRRREPQPQSTRRALKSRYRRRPQLRQRRRQAAAESIPESPQWQESRAAHCCAGAFLQSHAEQRAARRAWPSVAATIFRVGGQKSRRVCTLTALRRPKLPLTGRVPESGVSGIPADARKGAAVP